MSRLDCHAASCRKPSQPGPIYVTPGAVKVKVYSVQNRGREMFTVVYSLAGRRNRLTRATLEGAKAEAQAAAKRIAQGRTAVGHLNQSDYDALAVARRLLVPLGVTLSVAIEEYAAARRKLPMATTVLSVVEHFVASTARRFQSYSVAQVVEEFLDTKEQAGCSVRHLETLRMHVRGFAKAFQCDIDGIGSRDLDAWLCRIARNPRSRRNYRGSLTNLFSFARRRNYLPRDAKTEAEMTEQPRVVSAAIEVLSPEVFQSVLDSMVGEARVYAAIGGLAGLRSAEMLRLRWEDFADDHIVVTAQNAKTARRRTVRIGQSLRLWLEPYRSCSGIIFSRTRSHHVFLKHVSKVVPSWPKNALRRSFISYAVAHSRDVQSVALEAGNSASVIHRDYRQIKLSDGRLITEQLAEKWFGVVPS